MQWQEEAIILGIKRHGESSVIAEVMTKSRGRHLGLVRGGRSRKQQPVLQPGNLVDVIWRARLDEHLGEFRIEPIRQRAAQLMEQATSLYGLQSMAALLRLLPERDPHPHLYEALDIILDHLHEPQGAGALFVRFELAVLNDLGFGLDLTECAATGQRRELVYVSPKSGRAVSREAGQPWADKMLRLPSFLTGEGAEGAGGMTRDALSDAFRLTAHFLHRHVYDPRGIPIPSARDGFVQAALKGVNSE